MKYKPLEEIIRSHVHLGRPNSHGWNPCLCKVCNDRGHKGDRAAFRFDGEVVGYNCFNCGISSMYDPNLHRSMPSKMVKILTAFDIPDGDWQRVVFNNLGIVRKDDVELSTHVSIEPKEINIPSFFVPLNECHNEIADYAREYLELERGIDPASYPFYIVADDMITDKLAHKWTGRLIIPVYKNKKLIFYQGRDLTGLNQRKYLSPSVERENVLYGYENLHTNIDEPLFVTEGWFDAFLLGGVAVFGNKLYDAQIKWLNQSRRKKIVIPDRGKDGRQLATQAIDLGWAVSTPDAPECKDPNEIIKKYGMLYALQTIHKNTKEGFAAKVAAELYCK